MKLVRPLIKWIAITLLCVLFAEFTVRVWDIEPRYALRGKGVAGGRGLITFRLDSERLFQFIEDNSLGINKDGFREHALKPKGKAQRILVIGDSFPMGLAVEDQETFPNQLEQLLPGREVLNLGVAGYGPDQELAVLRKYVPILEPDRVIVVLYPPNDFSDLLRNGLFRVEAGAVVANHPNPVEEVLPSLRLEMALRLITTRHFLRPVDEARLEQLLFADTDLMELSSPEDIERSDKLLRYVLTEMRDFVQQRAIPLTVAILPSYSEIQGSERSTASFKTERQAAQIVSQAGIPLIDLTDTFREWQGKPLYLEDDRHLNPQGHKLVAIELEKAMQSPAPTGEGS